MVFLFTTTTVFAQSGLESLNAKKIQKPTDLGRLIDTFSNLEFSWIQIEDGKQKHNVEVKYIYEGKEEVNGNNADKIIIKGSENVPSMNIWYFDDEIIQMKAEGKKIPAAVANTTAGKVMESAFFPYYLVQNIDFEEIKEDDLISISNTNDTINDRDVEIIELEGENVVEWNLKSGSISYIDFGEFLIVKDYDFTTFEDVEVKFETEVIKLR